MRLRLDGSVDEGVMSPLLTSALSGGGEGALMVQAARLRRLADRGRQRLGRSLEPFERLALGGPVVKTSLVKPVVVTSDHVAASGEWLLVDASGGPIDITVPASALGDELRLRRSDDSTNAVFLTGAVTAALGPGHALLLKGELGGAWGAW